MSTIRCGLIGFGAWGEHHARAISATAGAELTAICARSPESAQRAGAAYPHARVFNDYHQMLQQSELDLCDIVLPSHLHFDAASAVLSSGRHLLLEKPMALSLEHCRRLIELAREKSRLLAIVHELRLSSLWGKVKDLIDGGAIGAPLYAMIDLWRKPYRQGAGGWRYDLSRVGDWILEEPIHFFDLARWYFQQAGDPVSVYAAGVGQRKDHPELHDNFSAIVQFPGGVHATITQSLSGWEHHQTARIAGRDGAIWASWSGATDRTFSPSFWLKLRRGEMVEEIPIDHPSGEVYELVAMVGSVVKAVREGNTLSCTGEDGWWSAAMCLKAAESLKSGTPVLF